MGLFDLLSLVIDNLGRRKGRVALTAVGVIIGTAAVVILVSLAIGLQNSATAQLSGIGDLTLITVYPNYGGGGGPGFVAVPVEGDGSSTPEQLLIKEDTIAELSTIPGVKTVIPRDYLMGGAKFVYNRMEGYFGAVGVDPEAFETLGLVSEQGSAALEKGSAILGSNIPMNFYDPKARPGQEPPPPPELNGEQIRMDLIKYDEQGNEISKKFQIKINGILKTTGTDDWSVYMPLSDVTAYNEWFTGKRINRNRDGYPDAMVKVNDPKNVKDVYDAIIALGYQAYSPQPFVEGINSFFLVLQVVFGGVGAIALLVAAIGIANTMAMAILERTREIGLMKALGATNRDVLSVFLGEAAGIGFIGGLGGIVLGWTASQIMNVVAVAYLAGQAAQQGGAPPPTTTVVTPVWLLIFALFFATIIGLISGLYPALRAATLVPITALKYE